MASNEFEQRIFKVPIVGAPLSGKTSVVDYLKLLFEAENETGRHPCRYVVLPEAFGLLAGPVLDRYLLQLELTRIQLSQEEAAIQRANDSHDPRPTVLVIDGGLPTVLNYCHQNMRTNDFEPIFKEHSLWLPWLASVFAYSDAIIELETLAWLQDTERVAGLFYDGRRLDSPASAREMHRNLQNFVGTQISWSPVYSFRADQSLEGKQQRIYEMLIQDLPNKWYFKLPEVSQKIVEAHA